MASDKHDVSFLNATGAERAPLAIAHAADGLADLIRRLDRFNEPAKRAVAIERRSGPLVDTLVEAGSAVVPIHPNAMKVTRPRYGAALGQIVSGDAHILADMLRADGHRFRTFRAPSDATKALRAASRIRDDHVDTRVHLADQRRGLLEGFWAGATVILAALDSSIALAFLDSFPTPASAARLGENRLERVLKRNAYSGRRAPADLLEHLRAAPIGHADELERDEGRARSLPRHRPPSPLRADP